MEATAHHHNLTTAVRHHPVVLALTVALCVVAAIATIAVQPPVYRGTALLFVDERYNSTQGFDLALQAGELLSAHYVQIATTQPVLDRACKTIVGANGRCRADQLARTVSANTVQGTSMIAVNANERSPAQAASVADAVAVALVDQNKVEVAALVDPTAQHLTDQLKQIDGSIATEQQAVAQFQGDESPNGRAQLAVHQARLAELQARHNDLVTQQDQLALQRLRLEGALTLYQLSPTPSRPVAPDPLLYLGAALAVGLVVGLLGVVLLDRFDDRVFDAEELGTAIGAPLALTIPPDGEGKQVRIQQRYYALARAHLLALRPDLGSLLVTAASDRDPASDVAAGLAAAGANAGQRVLLLDAQPRWPPAAARPSSPLLTLSPLTGDEAINAMADPRRDGYDLTVYATPPPNRDPAGVLVAKSAEMAVLVVTVRRTRLRDARRAAEALRFAGVELAACILVLRGHRRKAGEGTQAPEAAAPEVRRSESQLPTWRGPAAS